MDETELVSSSVDVCLACDSGPPSEDWTGTTTFGFCQPCVDAGLAQIAVYLLTGRLR